MMTTEQPTSKTQEIPGYLVLRIATEAQVDPTTVRRHIRGLATRPACRDRILAAMARLGLQRPTEARR